MKKRKQHIPDIDFDRFLFGRIKKLFEDNKIHINYEYQRGDVWRHSQQVELINSINNQYSIGVLVLYINENKQFEILDGQQRLLTIKKYIDGKLDLKGTEIEAYDDLSPDDRISLDAYSIGYLKLKSHNQETKEEDIIQTFLRLQEGSPLNKAEKINAYRGEFKNVFRDAHEKHNIFKMMGEDRRFRLRQLSAEMLLLELESDFENKIFPGLELSKFKEVIKNYEFEVSNKKKSFFMGNLDYLYNSLNFLLTAITAREIIPIYLLVSYLRREKADNTNLMEELSIFAEEILKDLNSFSIYDAKPPKEMSNEKFKKYLKYKTEARKATSAESIKYRFDFFLEEFKEKHPFILKDPNRLHDAEQKRILFLRQKGLCAECNKIIDFRIDGSSHHILAHKDGGSTDDINNAVLLHKKCHSLLEEKLKKKKLK